MSSKYRDLFYGFLDTGTQSVILPYDEKDNSGLQPEVINGVGNQEKHSYTNEDHEILCPGETLNILPENELQEFGFSVYKPPGKPEFVEWKRGREKLVGRRYKGSYFLNKSDKMKIRHELARRHHRTQFENGSRYFNRSNREFSVLVRFFPSLKNVAEVAREKLGPKRNEYLWRRCYNPIYYIYMVIQSIKRDDSLLPKFTKRISGDILKPRRIERVKFAFAKFCGVAEQQPVARLVDPVVVEVPVIANQASHFLENPTKTFLEPSSHEYDMGTTQWNWSEALEKMQDFEFEQIFAAHEKLKAHVEDFEKEMQRLDAKSEKRRAAKKLRGLREAQTSAESAYPARQVPSLLPISHWFHHRPHNVNCVICNRAKMIAPANVKTPVEEEGTSYSKVYLYADFVGKQFPMSTRGNVQGLCIGNSLGDVYISPQKSKSASHTEKRFKRYFELTHSSPANCIFKVDKLGIKPLKEAFPEMEIHEGIAHHHGSHAKAESIVKDCLYGLRALFTCRWGPCS